MSSAPTTTSVGQVMAASVGVESGRLAIPRWAAATPAGVPCPMRCRTSFTAAASGWGLSSFGVISSATQWSPFSSAFFANASRPAAPSGVSAPGFVSQSASPRKSPGRRR